MICAIVLAAGLSRRMGAQKLLLPLAGQTVIGHVVDRVLQSEVRQVFVVVSDGNNGVTDAVAPKRVSIVVNSDTQGDMLSSVRAGLRALPKACEAALLVLGDQPTLQPQIINQLIDCHRTMPDKINVPAYEGKRGHPLLFARRYITKVLTHYDGIGLRGLLQEYADEVNELAVHDADVLEDMDLPKDYQKIRRKLS
jgi:molybdenum cofactor cytidylyltransferase